MTPQDIQDKAWQDLGPVTGDFGKKYEEMHRITPKDMYAPMLLGFSIVVFIFAVVYAWIRVFAL